jgi:hypothetical protein
VPLEFAKGVISFNPQPTARNFNRPARMLRLGPSSPKDRNQILSNTGSDFLPCLFPLRPLCLCGETHLPCPHTLTGEELDLVRPSRSVTEWNNRDQPETPARRSSRVISVRRFEFFQPIVVLAAARFCGAATTDSLLSPKISKASSREQKRCVSRHLQFWPCSRQ